MPSPPECYLDPFYDPDFEPADAAPEPDLQLDMPGVELKEFIAEQLRLAQRPESIRRPRPKPRVRTRGYLSQENQMRMTDPKKLERIADSIADPFLEGAILDRTGLPDWHNPPPEVSWIDERIGLADDGKRLRRELEALATDPSVLAELAKTDPQAAQTLRDQQEEQAAVDFIKEHPAYYLCDANADKLDAYLDSHGLLMTAQNLDRAYRELTAAGKLQVSPNEPRTIPVAEQIRLARMAASGDVQNALAGYLQCRLPEAVAHEVDSASTFGAVEDLISQPENQPLLREATITVWFWSHPQIKPTPELRQWFADYTREMLTFTSATLDHAHFLFVGQSEEQREAEKAPVQLQPVNQDETPASLEELSDDEVVELMRGVRRERARG